MFGRFFPRHEQRRRHRHEHVHETSKVFAILILVLKRHFTEDRFQKLTILATFFLVPEISLWTYKRRYDLTLNESKAAYCD